jgi:hypothetical protein
MIIKTSEFEARKKRNKNTSFLALKQNSISTVRGGLFQEAVKSGEAFFD